MTAGFTIRRARPEDDAAVARELAESGTYSAIGSDAISYTEANALFPAR